MPLAKLDTCPSLHLFFPMLWKSFLIPPPLTTEQVALVTEKAIRAAAIEVCPADIALWSPKYEAEVFRARSGGHGTTISGVQIPMLSVARFGEVLMEKLANEVEWGEGALFFLDVRGHKSLCHHEPYLDNGDDDLDVMGENLSLWQRAVSVPALRKFLSTVDIEGLVEGTYPGVQAWIDVVLEVQSEGLMTAWLQKGHEGLIRHIFLKTSHLDHDENPAETDSMLDLLQYNSHYTWDPICTLTGVSGFRFE